MNRKLLLLLVLGLIAPSTAYATRIYSLVDYPDLQNGHSLRGTITTTDEAHDDGMLVTEEIVNWEWEVSDEFNTIVGIGQLEPAIPNSSTLMEVSGIQIDSHGIYLPQDLESFLSLEIEINNNSRGFNIRRLSWLNGNPNTPVRYIFNGITGGDIGFLAWGSDLPTNPDRWLIATSVPEPSSATLAAIVVIVGLFHHPLHV